MATKPTFRYTGFVQLPINRRVQGQFVDGDWVEGGITVVTAKCNVQPLKPSELMLLPESERTREWLKVYSDVELRTAQEGIGGWEADEFVWQGYTYKVMKDYNFAMGVLDHWKAWAARVPVTPN
jgi:hypothetical protein